VNRDAVGIDQPLGDQVIDAGHYVLQILAPQIALVRPRERNTAADAAAEVGIEHRFLLSGQPSPLDERVVIGDAEPDVRVSPDVKLAGRRMRRRRQLFLALCYRRSTFSVS
jgi:hypothetical protein